MLRGSTQPIISAVPYQALDSATAMPSAPPPSYADAMKQPAAFAPVYSLQDQQQISAMTGLEAPKQLQQTLAVMRSDEYVSAFKAKEVGGDSIVDGLNRVFRQYEIPIGLISKLTAFKGATLHFKIDDSGSMTRDSNLLVADLSPYMRRKVGDVKRTYTSRWEEAEDRLHILMELLAYVPTGPIILSSFDRDRPGMRITLDRTGLSPEAFLADAHEKISQFFNREPDGGTPILSNLQNMVAEAERSRRGSDRMTMHYLLTDGEPGGGPEEIRQIKNFLRSMARNDEYNPVTILGCSNVPDDLLWMHEVEEVARKVAALPDYKDELIEVRNDQGRTFPYSRGMWLLCNVAAAINPDDLDALDKHYPLTKRTLENVFGRGLTDDAYLAYFNAHPNAQRVFGRHYDRFLSDAVASTIPSVSIFQKNLRDRLNEDIDDDRDNTEEEEVRNAERAVAAYFVRQGTTAGYGAFNGRYDAGVNQPLAPAPDNGCPCVLL